jgi:hypothetical protein
MMPVINLCWGKSTVLINVILECTGTGTGTKTDTISRDAPDIRPDYPAFFYIRYPSGCQIALPDIR